VIRRNIYQTWYTRKRSTIPIPSSGVSNDVVLPDGTIGSPGFQLISPAGGSNDIRIRRSSGGFPIPPWVADRPTSAWMVPNNNNAGEAPAGNYIYRTTLDLSAYDSKSIIITGLMSVDNICTVVNVNGTANPVSIQGFSSMQPFNLDRGFIRGLNAIDIIVFNDVPNNNPTGLMVEWTATGIKR
jgi:hypothetical protein